MSKRMFQVIDDMNLSDVENDTQLIRVGYNLLSADIVKQGAKITIGVDEQCMNDIVSEKSMAILVVINKEDYFKRKELQITKQE